MNGDFNPDPRFRAPGLDPENQGAAALDRQTAIMTARSILRSTTTHGANIATLARQYLRALGLPEA